METFLNLVNRVVSERSQELRLTSKELAKKLGVSYPVWRQICRGDRYIPAEMVPKLCNALADDRLLEEMCQHVDLEKITFVQIGKQKHRSRFEAVAAFLDCVSEVLNGLVSIKNETLPAKEREALEIAISRASEELYQLEGWVNGLADRSELVMRGGFTPTSAAQRPQGSSAKKAPKARKTSASS